jgi:hypothetical protein
MKIPHPIPYQGSKRNLANRIRIEINAGRSTQATLLNRKEYTYETIYLSPSLVSRTDFHACLYC